MTLTPRQIAAYLEFSGELDRIEWSQDSKSQLTGRAGSR
jgi:hypothetical protein